MVCNRCIMVVKDILKKEGIENTTIVLGKASFTEVISDTQFNALKNSLEGVGFEIIDDNKSKLIESIKQVVIELVYNPTNNVKVNFSHYLEQKLDKNYNYLSTLFSAVEGYTIEAYIIKQKIEKVKELLVYEQSTLSEIASELGYSSVGHLSNQFKKVTGLTPSHFKHIRMSKRNSIDDL